MYDGFPLKRADQTTRGDQYQYVIQSLDAALRHVFSFPTGVTITPPFSIAESGDVEILQSLSIGSEFPIDEIVGEIPAVPEDRDISRLANVTSIRAFTAEFVDDYVNTQGLFVLRAGDTMSGPLVADGGITASGDLEISNALFMTDPSLAAGVFLKALGTKSLIGFDSEVLVGDSTETLHLRGAGGRPLYKGENVALVSDIVGTIPGLPYVPKAGGTFDGLIDFDAGLRLGFGNQIILEWNLGLNSFSVVQVDDDSFGDVVFDSGNGMFWFQGDVLADAFDLNVGTRENVLQWAGGYIQLGHATEDVNIVGVSARPFYKGDEIALLNDVAGTFVEGSGINFDDLGGGVSAIEIEVHGINVSHMPLGDEGQYSRISGGGLLEWSDLDIIAGTGMVVTTHGITKQVTLDINDEGVDTAQIAENAITEEKVGDDSIHWEAFIADRTNPTGDFGLYTLIVDTQGTPELKWQKGGAAGVLGSIETLTDSAINSSLTVLVTALDGFSGPYMIYSLVFSSLTSSKSGVLEVYIDGVLVIEETIPHTALGVIGNEVTYMFDFPFFAKESFEIKFMKVGGGSGSVGCAAKAIRMA